MPGTYTVRFNRDGWKAYQKQIEVAPGQTVKASFEFLPGSATITSTPAGATVFLNGTEAGYTPIDLAGLPEGIAKVEVRLDGHEPETFELNIPFGGSDSKSLSLLRLDRIITRATDLDILPTHEGGNAIVIPANLLAGFSGKAYVRFVIGPDGRVESAELVNAGTMRRCTVGFTTEAIYTRARMCIQALGRSFMHSST